MPTAAFLNLGCKVNQYETERLQDSFRAQGFSVADFHDAADVYVINTCSVTADADRKSRLMARRARRANPDGKVVLTGCFAQMALDMNEPVSEASLLVPNDHKMRTVARVLDAFPDLFEYSGSPAAFPAGGVPLRGDGTSLAPPLLGAGGPSVAVFPEAAPAGLITLDARPARRTRATLKIQDGCQYFCAFCSIAHTRNTMASRPLADVLAEARQMANAGAKEIVVTGVCVGAYGPGTGSGGARLVDVLTQVADIPGIERVRLSSVQPVEVPPELMDALAAHPNIAPHLHLSLQAGDNDVLRAMNRPYDTAFFADTVAELRARVPRIGLTTDLIVGFPGETAERFENTVSFARRMEFARTHVFRFSPRQRTAGWDMTDDVPHQEKERRHRELSAVCLQTQREFARGDVGRTVDVLLEAKGAADGILSGYTGNYVRVQVPASASMRGRIVPVLLTDVQDNGDAAGELACHA